MTSKLDHNNYGPHKVADICIKCGKTEGLTPCRGCGMTQYCSEECRATHWDTHESACTPSVSRLMTAMQQNVNRLLASERFGVFMHALAWQWGVFSAPQCHMQCSIIAPGDDKCLHLRVVRMMGPVPNAAGTQQLSILYKTLTEDADSRLWMQYVLTMKKTDCELMYNGRNMQLFSRIGTNTEIEITHHVLHSVTQVIIGLLRFTI